MRGILLLNAALLAATHWSESEVQSRLALYANIIFTSAFVVESLLGICGRGIRLYWRVSWNRFDLLVTIASVIDVIIAGFFATSKSLSVFVSVLRVTRVLRLVRLARR